MTRKRSNVQYTNSVHSRRRINEIQASGDLGPRRNADHAAQVLNRMAQEEKDRLKAESRRKQEPMMPPPGLKVPAQQRQKQRVVSQLEKELMEQARERGVNRHTARQTLFDKLTWRDGDTLEAIRLRRWNIVVFSDKWVAKHAPEEICCFAVSNGNLTQQLRIVATPQDPEPCKSASSKSFSRVLYWNPHSPSHVNNISVHMSKFLHGGWNSLVLTPSHQMSQLANVLHWMKETRDAFCRRDTTSIRLDRLMCIEDVISVFRTMCNKSAIDSDDDEPWEQLKEMDETDTMLFGSAACEYFISALAKSTEKSHGDTTEHQLSSDGIQSCRGNKGSGISCTIDASNLNKTQTMASENDDPVQQKTAAENVFGPNRLRGSTTNPFAFTPAVAKAEDDMPNVRAWLQNIIVEEIEPTDAFEPFWDDEGDTSHSEVSSRNDFDKRVDSKNRTSP